MKTKSVKNKKPILEELRAVRDQLSNELTGKTPEQIVEYLKKKKTLHSSAIWKKNN